MSATAEWTSVAAGAQPLVAAAAAVAVAVVAVPRVAAVAVVAVPVVAAAAAEVELAGRCRQRATLPYR